MTRKMLIQRDPYAAYQRVEFDARVKGASPSELVLVCFDQLILSLGTALLAEQRKDASLRSRSLTQALTAVMALQLGIDQNHGMAGALTDFYGSARKSILASSLDFNVERLRMMREDFQEIRDAFLKAGI